MTGETFLLRYSTTISVTTSLPAGPLPNCHCITAGSQIQQLKQWMHFQFHGPRILHLFLPFHMIGRALINGEGGVCLSNSTNLARPGVVSTIGEDAYEDQSYSYAGRSDPESSLGTTSLDIAGLTTPSCMAYLRQRYM